MSELILHNKNNLPKGWVETTLDNLIVKMSNGTTEKQIQEKTKYPVSRIETISKEFIDFAKVHYLNNPPKDIIEKYMIKQGDILFSNINSDIHLGKTAIFYENQTLIHGMNLLLIRPENRIIIPKFLNFYFKYYRKLGKFISIAQHAVNQSSINQTKLKNLSFIIPPINEQKRIVVKIEELFSLINFIKNSLEIHSTKLSHYEKSLLSFAFSGKLSSMWRSNFKKTSTGKKLLEDIFEQRRLNYARICELSKKEGKKKPKKPDNLDYEEISVDRIPYAIPDDWIWCFTNYVCKQITDGEHINPKYTQSGNLLLSAKNIQKGYVTFEDVNYISDTAFEKATLRCKPEFNDVLVTSTGTVGRVAILKEQKAFAILRSVLLLKPDIILPEFLLYYLHTPIAFKLMSNASSASVQAHLYIGDMKQFPFPLPSLDEQKTIIQIIDPIIFKIKIFNNECKKLLSQLQILRLSILKNAFEGKLVPQDPNDESAEILLATIKQEKQKIISQTNRGKKNDK